MDIEFEEHFRPKHRFDSAPQLREMHELCAEKVEEKTDLENRKKNSSIGRYKNNSLNLLLHTGRHL